MKRYPVDPERLFVVGFSQGAIMGMTLSLATDLPIAGVVALSGYIPTHEVSPAIVTDLTRWLRER